MWHIRLMEQVDNKNPYAHLKAKHKAELSSGKVVFLRDPKFVDVKNADQASTQVEKVEETVKACIVAVIDKDGNNINWVNDGDIDKYFHIKEIADLFDIVGESDLFGGKEKKKLKPLQKL